MGQSRDTAMNPRLASHGYRWVTTEVFIHTCAYTGQHARICFTAPSARSDGSPAAMSTFGMDILVSNTTDLFSPVQQTKALWRNGPILSLRQEIIYKMSPEQRIVPESKKMLQKMKQRGVCQGDIERTKRAPNGQS